MAFLDGGGFLALALGICKLLEDSFSCARLSRKVEVEKLIRLDPAQGLCLPLSGRDGDSW
jgi:hypothetical protein